MMDSTGMPWGFVQNAVEVTEDPQARANGVFIPYDHPTYGHMELVAGPVNLSSSPIAIRMAAPFPGQHNEEILTEYGYTEGEIYEFRQKQLTNARAAPEHLGRGGTGAHPRRLRSPTVTLRRSGGRSVLVPRRSSATLSRRAG